MIRDLSALPDRPAVDERAPTLKYLPPVFCGTRVPPFPAHLPLPEWPRPQSDISTVDLRVRATAPSVSRADTPAPAASDVWEGVDVAVGANGVRGGR